MSDSDKHGIVRSVALTAFVFGLLIWMYVVAIQITHPGWVVEPLSHVDIFPLNWRLDELGMAAFAMAAAGFLVWQIEFSVKTK